MNRWLIQWIGRDEVAWFNPEPQTQEALSRARSGIRRRGAIDPVSKGPRGALAAAVLRSLAGTDAKKDLDRARSLLLKQSRLRVVDAVPWSSIGVDLASVRQQLLTWYARGQIRWNPNYAGLESDDGPSTHILPELMDAVHWRGPDDVVADSFGGAVLASAVTGALHKTLFVCLACRRLLTRDTPGWGWRRKRCDDCRERWNHNWAPYSLQREYLRLKDRARKRRPPISDGERRELVATYDRIVARMNGGQITEADAISRIDRMLPRSSRGRRRRF